ncbi:hypothetical protein I3I95_02125 [bacterium]|nr:hypothetical protein [bacterium]
MDEQRDANDRTDEITRPESSDGAVNLGATVDPVEPAESAEPAYTIEPVAEGIDFETFSKSDMRVVRVRACEAVKKSKKLLRFTLDDGSGTERTILSGIHAFYEPEELVGKNLVAIVNIPPCAMMGVESCGMLLSAVCERDGEEVLNLLMVDDAIPAGSRLY